MEEIIYSQNNNSTISCYSMDFSGISKQNAHGGRNVMPQGLSEGVDIFLKSADKQGKADTMSASAKPCLHGFWRTWMVRVGDPVMMRTAVSLFTRKFTPGDATSRRDIPFAVGVRGVYGNLRYEPCFQFINVSQRAVHIYFIDGCRVCPVRPDARYKVKSKNSDL